MHGGLETLLLRTNSSSSLGQCWQGASEDRLFIESVRTLRFGMSCTHFGCCQTAESMRSWAMRGDFQIHGKGTGDEERNPIGKLGHQRQHMEVLFEIGGKSRSLWRKNGSCQCGKVTSKGGKLGPADLDARDVVEVAAPEVELGDGVGVCLPRGSHAEFGRELDHLVFPV
jgi:hypothetical protein